MLRIQRLGGVPSADEVDKAHKELTDSLQDALVGIIKSGDTEESSKSVPPAQEGSAQDSQKALKTKEAAKGEESPEAEEVAKASKTKEAPKEDELPKAPEDAEASKTEEPPKVEGLTTSNQTAKVDEDPKSEEVTPEAEKAENAKEAPKAEEDPKAEKASESVDTPTDEGAEEDSTAVATEAQTDAALKGSGDPMTVASTDGADNKMIILSSIRN